MAKGNESGDSKNEKITPAGESASTANSTTTNPAPANTTETKQEVNPATSDATSAAASTDEKSSEGSESAKKNPAKKAPKEVKDEEKTAPEAAPASEEIKPLNFGFKQWTKDEAKKVFEGRTDQMAVLAMSITKLFFDANQTSLAKPTFKEVLDFCGPLVNQFSIVAEYADDENLSGKITLKEFDQEVTLPISGGLFTFGKDYSVGS